MIESIKHLRYLVALAEHQNFHRAAEAANVSQSALSQAIKKLEDYYELSLFDRQPQAILPTAHGEILIRSARLILDELNNMRREMHLLQNLGAGRIVIGAHTYFAEPLIAPVLGENLHRYPDIGFNLEIGDWDVMHEKLINREIDIYVGFPLERDDARFASECFDLPRFYGICRSGHPLLELDEIYLSDVLKYPAVTPRAPRWVVNEVVKNASYHNGELLNPRPDIHLTPDTGVIRNLLKFSDATTTSFLSPFKLDIIAGELSSFEIQDLTTHHSVCVCQLNNRIPSPVVEMVILMLQKKFSEFQEGGDLERQHIT
jgi:DNA-binding transcriptional LysR family regulator